MLSKLLKIQALFIADSPQVVGTSLWAQAINTQALLIQGVLRVVVHSSISVLNIPKIVERLSPDVPWLSILL